MTPEQRTDLAKQARQAAKLADRQRQAGNDLASIIEQCHTIDGIRWRLDSPASGLDHDMRQWAGQLLASLLASQE